MLLEFSSSQSNFKENLPFIKVIKKQICGAHVFSHHAGVVLPPTTTSITHHASTITVEAS
jgi:hypothetical protein